MTYPNTGFSAVYTQPQTAANSNTEGCPGGTGCSVGNDARFSALPQLSGAFQNQMVSSGNGQQIMPQQNQPMAVTPENLQYLNGFIRTQIGKRVTVEFLVGTNTLTDRTGILVGVGANYILLNEVETDDLLACDFYNIKFIRFYY